MRPFPLAFRALAAVVGVAAVVACEATNDTTGITPTTGTGANATVGAVDWEEFEICKNGSSASFSWTAIDNASGAQTSDDPSLTNGECQVIVQRGGAGAQVSVEETSAEPGFQFDSVWVYVKNSDNSVTSYRSTNPKVDEEVSGSGGTYGLRGVLAIYYNSAIPTGGGEGCTPGYWKQSQHFDSWTGYAPTDLFSSVFENAFPGMTLLQVLQQGGGGLKALGRHTVAALLNSASSVSYDMDTPGVINAFNAVFPGGDYEGQKNIFAGYNEQGCPLN